MPRILLGRLNFPIWRPPGYDQESSLSTRQKRGIFLTILKLRKRDYNIIYGLMSASLKGAASREGSGACDSVKRNSGILRILAYFISESGFINLLSSARRLYYKVKQQKMGMLFYKDTGSQGTRRTGSRERMCATGWHQYVFSPGVASTPRIPEHIPRFLLL